MYKVILYSVYLLSFFVRETMKTGDVNDNHEEFFENLDELMAYVSKKAFDDKDISKNNMDVRRCLDNIFEVKRLQSELDDYGDY